MDTNHINSQNQNDRGDKIKAEEEQNNTHIQEKSNNNQEKVTSLDNVDGQYSLSSKDHSQLNQLPISTPNQLFQWAIDNSDPNVLKQMANEKNLKPIDPKWMNAIFGEDTSQQIKKLLIRIVNENLLIEERCNALSLLTDFIEDIDNANILHKLGGLQPVISLLKHNDINIIIGSLSLISAGAANNPIFQDQLLKNNGIPVIIHCLNTHLNHDEVVKKSLLAISATIRNYRPCLEEFINLNGFHLIIKLVSHSNPLVRQRISYLLQFLLDTEGSIVYKQLISENYLNRLSTSLDYENTEEFLNNSSLCVLNMVKENPHCLDGINKEFMEKLQKLASSLSSPLLAYLK